MELFDHIVVGSGPAGAHAAYALRGRKTLLVDAGLSGADWQYEAMADKKRRKGHVVEETLGARFESLNNLERYYLSPKLKAPYVRYITDTPDGARPDDGAKGFLRSYALGGLANAWGGGVYRFSKDELAEFPYSYDDLSPYYDQLSELMRIQGADDDLDFSLGREPRLQEPFALTSMATILMNSYARRRAACHQAGFFLGRPRLALLTEAHRGRSEYKYFGDDFFSPRLSGLYSPYFTVKEMVEKGEINYEGGWVVRSFRESNDIVEVTCRAAKGGAQRTFYGRSLLLGAGALNSARIALESYGDETARLPIIENPISFVPAICPRHFCMAPNSPKRIGGEALVCFRHDDGRISFAAFYGLEGPLRADLWGDLPLPIRGKFAALRHLIPSMGMFQMFHEGYVSPRNRLFLKNGMLETGFEDLRYDHDWERRLARFACSMGFYTHPKLIVRPPAGSSIHYAGSLPMSKSSPNRYETDAFGRLGHTHHVYVVDSAAFPTIPSKNLTFTIMAHAMRVADNVRRQFS